MAPRKGSKPDSEQVEAKKQAVDFSEENYSNKDSTECNQRSTGLAEDNLEACNNKEQGQTRQQIEEALDTMSSYRPNPQFNRTFMEGDHTTDIRVNTPPPGQDLGVLIQQMTEELRRDRQPPRPYHDPVNSNNSSRAGYEPRHQWVKTPNFNGKSRWDIFIKQFEAIGRNNHWSPTHRLNQLITALTEDAAEYAFQLDEEILDDYYHLTNHLARRFDVKQTREACQQLFYSRELLPNENPRELAADLKTLIQKAYPSGISPEVREDMLLKQFFDGIGDPETTYMIKYMQRPRFLDQAVDMVFEYKSYKGNNDKRRKLIRPVQSHSTESSDNKDVHEICTAKYQTMRPQTSTAQTRNPMAEPERDNISLRQMMQETLTLLKKLVQDKEGNSETKPKSEVQGKGNKDPNESRSRNCYLCGDAQHFARNCPQKSNNRNPGKTRNPHFSLRMVAPADGDDVDESDEQDVIQNSEN